MNVKYTKQAYFIERLQNGEWVFCGYGESRDEGEAKLPKKVCDRVAQGRPGKVTTKGQTYRIRLAEEGK